MKIQSSDLGLMTIGLPLPPSSLEINTFFTYPDPLKKKIIFLIGPDVFKYLGNMHKINIPTNSVKKIEFDAKSQTQHRRSVAYV